MPEEIQIRPNAPTVNIPTPRGSASALQSLTNALRGFEKGIGDVIDNERRHELTEAEELFSSPLATEAEIDEVREGAFFNATRVRAQNAKGGVIAQRHAATFQDRLSTAKDSLEARRMAREFQQEIIDSDEVGGNTAVIAGVRQRVSDFIPGLLNEAATRRTVAREQQEGADIIEDFRLNLEEDPDQFAAVHLEGLSDVVITNGDQALYHSRSISALQGHLDDGFDPENPDVNPNGFGTLQAVDNILKSDQLNLSPADRKAYVSFRNNTTAGLERQRTAFEKSGAAKDKALVTRVVAGIAAHKLQNPGSRVPDEWLELGLEHASQPSEVAALENAFYGAIGEQQLRGVNDTKEWRDTSALLEKTMTTQGDFVLSAEAMDTMNYFEALGATLPSELRDDPVELRRIAQEASTQAAARRKASKEAQAADLEKARAAVASHHGGGRPVDLSGPEMSRIRRETNRRVLLEWAEEHGARPRDFVNTSE